MWRHVTNPIFLNNFNLSHTQEAKAKRATEEHKRIQLIRPAACYSTHYTALGLRLYQSLSGLPFKGWQSLTTVHGFVMKPNVPFYYGRNQLQISLLFSSPIPPRQPLSPLKALSAPIVFPILSLFRPVWEMITFTEKYN